MKKLNIGIDIPSWVDFKEESGCLGNGYASFQLYDVKDTLWVEIFVDNGDENVSFVLPLDNFKKACWEIVTVEHEYEMTKHKFIYIDK